MNPTTCGLCNQVVRTGPAFQKQAELPTPKAMAMRSPNFYNRFGHVEADSFAQDVFDRCVRENSWDVGFTSGGAAKQFGFLILVSGGYLTPRPYYARGEFVVSETFVHKLVETG